MDDIVKRALELEDHTPFHKQMLEDTLTLVRLSRNKMSEYYAQWDKNDEVYRAIRKRDSEDIKAGERGEPEKMVVPISFAQVQTFVAFLYSLYMQRDRFFELTGFTAEDEEPAKVAEALLARDLSKNCIEAVLTQFLLDVGRFGLGIIKTCWVTESGLVEQEQFTPGMSAEGVNLSHDSSETFVDQGITYEGNKLTNISPYRFFPDVRLPLVRFQEGEFCASEDIYTHSQLKKWEKEGVVAGVNFIKPAGKECTPDRGYRWETDLDNGGAFSNDANTRGDGQLKKNIIITEVQRNIIPSEYMIEDKPLGEEDYPVKYVIWVANDNRIIKCEPMNYMHGQFTYSLAPFLFDNNLLVSFSLSDVMDQLQSVISWFINARITNVRKVIGDKLIVNPTMVNMQDLKERKPVIRLSAAATGEIDRYIKQLALVDVTATHVRDVKDLHDILKMVTGINDSLLGEVRPGKRSATENRNTTTGAAQRLKTIGAVIFRFALEQMGRQMLYNLRDGLDNQTYVRILGSKAATTPAFIQVDKASMLGHYDFEVFDATLPSERYLTAQALEEFVPILLQNPQAAVLLNLDPRKIINEILTLRGVRNPERFSLRPPGAAPDANATDPTLLALAGQQSAASASPAGSTGGASADSSASSTGPGGPASGVSQSLPKPLLSLLTSGAPSGGANGNGGGVRRPGTGY